MEQFLNAVRKSRNGIRGHLILIYSKHGFELEDLETDYLSSHHSQAMNCEPSSTI